MKQEPASDMYIR